VSYPIGWIAQYAAQRSFRYEPDADERWLRAWEPYTTLKPPIRYEHALHATGGEGSLSIARMITLVPGYAMNGEAIETEVSAWVAIAQDTRLQGAVAVCSDLASPFAEPLDLIAMKRRASGDPKFDHVFATFAPTSDDLTTALTPSLRKLLMTWRLPVHAEIRPGGFIVAPVSLSADVQGLHWFVDALQLFGGKASKRVG
jgi:hypothetical protein